MPTGGGVQGKKERKEGGTTGTRRRGSTIADGNKSVTSTVTQLPGVLSRPRARETHDDLRRVRGPQTVNDSAYSRARTRGAQPPGRLDADSP